LEGFVSGMDLLVEELATDLEFASQISNRLSPREDLDGHVLSLRGSELLGRAEGRIRGCKPRFAFLSSYAAFLFSLVL
jgi:hypothetical protein